MTIPTRIGWGVVIVIGILLMVTIFSGPSQEIFAREHTPMVVLETESEPDIIKLAESIDSASLKASAVPTESTEQEEDSSLDISESISQSLSTGLSSEERKNNAMLIREQRKEGMFQYREYNRLRREWRKELSAALRDARESSDYTYYEELKSNPPDKTDPTLYL